MFYQTQKSKPPKPPDDTNSPTSRLNFQLTTASVQSFVATLYTTRNFILMMPSIDFTPYYEFSSQGCQTKSLNRILHVHSSLIKVGIKNGLKDRNHVMNFYSNSWGFRNAYKLLDESPHPNCVCWFELFKKVIGLFHDWVGSGVILEKFDANLWKGVLNFEDKKACYIFVWASSLRKSLSDRRLPSFDHVVTILDDISDGKLHLIQETIAACLGNLMLRQYLAPANDEVLCVEASITNSVDSKIHKSIAMQATAQIIDEMSLLGQFNCVGRFIMKRLSLKTYKKEENQDHEDDMGICLGLLEHCLFLLIVLKWSMFSYKCSLAWGMWCSQLGSTQEVYSNAKSSIQVALQLHAGKNIVGENMDVCDYEAHLDMKRRFKISCWQPS